MPPGCEGFCEGCAGPDPVRIGADGMRGDAAMLRYVFRGLAAGTGVAVLALIFSAYLEPAVYLPAMNLLAMCR